MGIVVAKPNKDGASNESKARKRNVPYHAVVKYQCRR